MMFREDCGGCRQNILGELNTGSQPRFGHEDRHSLSLCVFSEILGFVGSSMQRFHGRELARSSTFGYVWWGSSVEAPIEGLSGEKGKRMLKETRSL